MRLGSLQQERRLEHPMEQLAKIVRCNKTVSFTCDKRYDNSQLHTCQGSEHTGSAAQKGLRLLNGAGDAVRRRLRQQQQCQARL